ncbi:MAG TPA: hypothetical protein ENJ20_00740, partial [Bacteroidetes bacterium]|nr:hypothetical protein [Bacteroidota bacterium]
MIPQLFLENKKRKLQQAFAVGGVAALSSFFLFAPQMAAQDTLHNRPAAKDYHLLFARDLPATWFTTDKLRHIYYILPKNEVIKMDANGTVLFSYFNKTLGPPAWIDATDPFNILLFYPDFQTITLLDRTMNPTGHFNLFEAGLFGINAVCMASDGNLWLYDPINFQLKKTGRHGQFILESADLSLQPGLKEALAPNLLLEKNQRVYLNDPRQG